MPKSTLPTFNDLKVAVWDKRKGVKPFNDLARIEEADLMSAVVGSFQEMTPVKRNGEPRVNRDDESVKYLWHRG
jgi:hypothetical protein